MEMIIKFYISEDNNNLRTMLSRIGDNAATNFNLGKRGTSFTAKAAVLEDVYHFILDAVEYHNVHRSLPNIQKALYESRPQNKDDNDNLCRSLTPQCEPNVQD